MLSPLFRPASCRRLAPLAARRFAALWLLSILFWAAFAHAHEGHDDEPPATSVAQRLPRLTAKSDMYELVAVLDGEQLTIYLDRYGDNSPVSNAVISVLIDAETVSAGPAPDSKYIVSSKLFRGSGSLDLVFDIQ